MEFSGNQEVSHFIEYKAIFEEVRKEGLKVSVHAAENKGQNEELDAILAFKPDRLGHTTHASVEQLKLITELGIPVEICPTSNLSSHEGNDYNVLQHFRVLNEEGGTIIICTDNTGLLKITHSDEVAAIADAFKLTGEQLGVMQLKAVDAIFDPN